MNLFTRIFLPVVLLVSSVSQAAQILPSGNSAVVTPSGDIVLEHALNDFHHYYPQCERQIVDFAVSPFFRHLNCGNAEFTNNDVAVKADQTFNMYGAFAQAQLNVCDFYLRANTIFGKMDEKLSACVEGKDVEGKTAGASADVKKSADMYVDNVNLRLGYDYFFNNCGDHLGAYVISSIPVYGLKTIDESIVLATPQMGVLNYTIGGGLNGSWMLCECDNNSLTFLADANYSYAFPRTIATVEKVDTKYTPGHTVSGWAAFHYAYCNWNVELGTALSTTFGDKCSSCAGDDKEEVKKDDAQEKVASIDAENSCGDITTVKFGAKPYGAVAYSTTICDKPVTFGLGAGYEFNQLQAEKAPNMHGFSVWGTAAVSF